MHPGDTTLHNDMLVIKKQLDPPSLTIWLRNNHWANVQCVSEEYKLPFVLIIPILDASDLIWAHLSGELTIHVSDGIGQYA